MRAVCTANRCQVPATVRAAERWSSRCVGGQASVALGPCSVGPVMVGRELIMGQTLRSRLFKATSASTLFKATVVLG